MFRGCFVGDAVRGTTHDRNLTSAWLASFVVTGGGCDLGHPRAMMTTMALAPDDLGPDHLAFLTERHLATLTTLRPDGTPHVAPVGFGYDPEAGLVRIITFEGSRKVRNVDATADGRAVVCQVDGARWLALEGPAEVVRDPARVAAAVEGYAARYRRPGERDDRVAIEIRVDRVLGRA